MPPDLSPSSSSSCARASTPPPHAVRLGVEGGALLPDALRRDAAFFTGLLESGARLDACDKYGVWYEAVIADVDEAAERVLVHFVHWSSRYDHWVHAQSPLLDSHGARTYQGAARGPLRAGQRLDFFTAAAAGGGGGGRGCRRRRLGRPHRSLGLRARSARGGSRAARARATTHG